MESFLPSEIARLVLGYLEDQKCEEAYTTFLKTSIHLEECLKMKEDGRKFRTQVLGLSLLDILYEYSAIYSLVQERLKKVDPVAVESLRHSGTLLDKITFLLNNTSSGQTMLFSISLPSGNSPQNVAHAHVRKRLRTCSNSNEKRTKKNPIQDVFDVNNSIHNLETTNLSSLPGNFNQSTTEDLIRTPKRKLQGNNNNKRQSRANSVVPEELDENFDITALTQALLDNHELHEKIAENINKVICTTPDNNSNVSMVVDHSCSAQNPTPAEPNTSVQQNNNFTMELDNVIKKIVHDTESDPVFENFLHEVVGPPTQEETSDDYDDRGISDTSTPSKNILETVKKQPLKTRKNAKTKRANSPEIITNTIEDHNAVAIESIISINAPETEPLKTSTEPIKTIENVTVPTTTIPTSTVAVTEPIIIATENTAPINTTPTIETINMEQNKSIVVQQQQQPQTYVIADSFPSIYPQQIMPIFLSNKATTIGSQYITMPSTFITQPTVITDNDIINMPTVFISDDPKTSSGYIISQPTTYKPRQQPPRRPSIKQHKQEQQLIQKTRTTPRSIKKKNEPEKVEVVAQPPPEPIKYTICIQTEPKPSQETEEEAIPSTSKKDVTPDKVKTTSTSKLQLSLSSPRSTKSHIRALDFSTPPKENNTPPTAKTPKSPKSQQKKTPKRHKSPVKTPPIVTKSPKVKLKGDWNEDLLISDTKKPKKSTSWDHELRSLIVPVPSSSQQKKTPGKRRTRASQRNKDKKQNIEQTEAITIEAELTKTEPLAEKRKKTVQKVELNIREEQTLPVEVCIIEEVQTTPEKVDKPEPVSAESLRNMTPKIRKKCNTNSTKKVETENKELTIMSPSKMDKNASKRSLVDDLPKLKATCSNETKRLPVLETPMKDETLLMPITPRLFTPFMDSPLTRLLGEKMDTGDLAPFLSPSFPMTPSFPITPNLQTGDSQSSYASRPTDYSTSSSYYQPSDNEQNQKLEQILIDEAMKIETKLITSTPCRLDTSSSSSSDNTKENNADLTVIQVEKTTRPTKELCVRLTKSPQIKQKRTRGRPKSPVKRLTNDKIKRPPGRPRKNTQDGGVEETDKHRELKSKVTGSHVNLLKELEEKRKRIISGLKQKPTSNNSKKKTNRVTRAAKLPKLRKSKTPATKTKKTVTSPLSSPVSLGQEDGLISYTPDEEIPRLHLSSDEDDFTLSELKQRQKKIDDSDLLVKELKERGIYLIPNKDKKLEADKLEVVEVVEPIKDKIEITSDIHLDKSKIIDVSKIELSQGIITDVINGTETVKEPESTLDVSDYDFHVKVINENSPEYIFIKYDETVKSEKGMSDYNFTVLKKNISAKIFIEELNKWEDKNFTVTPYIDIYTISPKRKKRTSLKPLEILYNEIVDESSTDTVITDEPKIVKKTKISLEQYKLNHLLKKDEKECEVVETIDEDEDSTNPELNKKKRKTTEGELKQNAEKRLKTNEKQKLLKSINLDTFLTEIHGPSAKT